MKLSRRPIRGRLTINWTANGGWLLNIGQHELVYTDLSQLVTDVTEILKEPKKAQAQMDQLTGRVRLDPDDDY